MERQKNKEGFVIIHPILMEMSVGNSNFDVPVKISNMH